MTIRPQDEFTKLGFALFDTVQGFSRSRGKNIARRRHKLAPFGALKWPDRSR
jgi:hypothetical protein